MVFGLGSVFQPFSDADRLLNDLQAPCVPPRAGSCGISYLLTEISSGRNENSFSAAQECVTKQPGSGDNVLIKTFLPHQLKKSDAQVAAATLEPV